MWVIEYVWKEIWDMIDVILLVIVCEYVVDESFVINEIKDYFLGIDVEGLRNNGLKVIWYLLI